MSYIKEATMFEDILLNALLILSPILFFQALFPSTHFVKGKKQRIYWGILSGLIAILCMKFPIYNNEIIWDLRNVPIMFSYFYGGFLSGFLTFISLISYRATLGLGVPFINALFVMLFILFVLSKVTPLYRNLSLLMKIYITIAANILFNTVGFIMSYYYLYSIDEERFLLIDFFQVYIITLIISSIIISVVIPIIEDYNKNQILKDELYKVEKLNIVSEMAAAIAHEVRNPLTVVRGFIQLSLEKLIDSDRLFMKTAIEELDRAEHIISDYLNLAKTKTTKLEELNIAHELNSIVDLTKSLANLNSVDLICNADSKIKIYADKLQFRQVLINLIKNAIEACAKADSKVIVSLKSEKEEVIIEVKDNGNGMSEEQLLSIGQPYFTTKESGTGLGLTVTFNLIKEMNGKLNYVSKLGEGTKAIVRLPIV
jgi:two-component system sporulation sensor kinase B